MVALVVLLTIAALLFAYLTYGKFVAKKLQINDDTITPACKINDGYDFVPAKPSLLIGQHFSAIAAAGPIVGPILAGLWFGWVPAIIWIILGSIFVGGVHDFSSLIASVRHKASSIGELVKEYMSPTSYIMFLVFTWLTLIYVIIAFTDITAQSFVTVSAGEAYGPSVASASFLYLLLAVILGVLLYKYKVDLKIATTGFIILFIAMIFLSTKLPPSISGFLSSISIKNWEVILLGYCFVASIMPMWLLLQPRGYLGGWFLYLTIGISLIGSLFGGFSIQYPAFNLDGIQSLVNGKYLFPLLFITVACGACSGFHGIVSSGTTSKQIEKESDTRIIGYGAMLLEGLVAVLALGTVMILAKGDKSLSGDPNLIYANGLAKYMGMIGVDYNLAISFALLAFATFVYDTLDVCTRLARYIFQELFNWTSKPSGYLATAITLVIPLVFLLLSKEKAYLSAWSVFGTSNQLLASLILLAVSVWLAHSGKKIWFTALPMLFMMVMTVWSLILLILPFLKAFPSFNVLTPNEMISGVSGVILFVMSMFIYAEAFKLLVLKKSK